jgi:hypothetical protein
MTDRCRVENDAVVEGPCALPTEYAGILNFHLHPNPEEFGWLPCARAAIPAYDASTETVDLTYAVDPAIVTETATLRALSADEIEARRATNLQGRTSCRAQLTIAGDDIQGIEKAVGLSAAMALEPHIYWLFFTNSEPDTDYLPATVMAPGFNADITYPLNTDFLEITVTDRTTGEPATPTQLIVSTQR